MCLAIPCRIIDKKGNRATIEIGNIQREIFIHLVPEVKIGQYVLVHAGCAIEIINEKEAFENLKLLKDLTENEIY